MHSHYYSFTFSITFLSRNIVVILRSCHFISFTTRKASSKFETRDSRGSPCRIANHYLIICALIPLINSPFNTVRQGKASLLSSLPLRSEWKHCLTPARGGPRAPGPDEGTRQAAPRRGSGATKKASPTMLVDTTSKSRNSWLLATLGILG